MTEDINSTSARPRVGYVVRRSAFHPINLGVAGASIVLAAGLQSWALGALGGLAYGALVIYDVFNPAFWRKTYSAKTQIMARLPDAKAIKDPGTRNMVAAIAAAKSDLARAVDETPPEVMANLATTMAAMAQFDGQVAHLVARAEDIAQHLASVDIQALRSDSSLLANRAQSTVDAVAKASFLEAKAARDDEIRTIGELRQAKDRVDATLSRLVAVLAGVPTKIVHMRALDAQALDQMSGGLNAEIESIADELKTSEEIIKSLGEVAK